MAQKAFVDAQLAGLTGLEAARRAGYRGSDATLKVRASKLLRHPEVSAAIEAGRAAAAVRVEATAAADPAIAGLVEQQRLLTAIARDEDAAAKDRIAAVAQLAKIQGLVSGAPGGGRAGGGGAVVNAAGGQVVVVVDNGRGPRRDG